MLGIVLLVIGVLVGAALFAAFRRPWESRRPVEPPMAPPAYRGYGRPYGYGQRHGYGRSYGYDEAYGYGRPRRSGMSPGAAGAIGAVGGGLLGYELGQMQDEQPQFRHDEMMMDGRDQEVAYADPGQGWPVEQDGPFDGGVFDDAGGADFDGSW